MLDLYLGVDLGGTNVCSALVDEDGNILGRDKRPMIFNLGVDRAIETMIASMKNALKDGGYETSDLKAIGIGSPGPLNPFTGVIINAVNLPGFRNLPLKAIMEEEFGVPVAVDNDANVVALGEQWRGAGMGVENFLCVTLGTGIGGGVISEGKLLRGFNGNAAEVGHITVDYNGPRCNCGNYGCVEVYASATAMVRRTIEKMEKEKPDTSLKDAQKITTEEIFKAANAGDKFTSDMFKETGKFLGIGIVSMINVLNVEVVAIGGGLAGAGDLIFEPVREVVLQRGISGVKEKVRIVPVELGDDAPLFGAAKLAMEGGASA